MSQVREVQEVRKVQNVQPNQLLMMNVDTEVSTCVIFNTHGNVVGTFFDIPDGVHVLPTTEPGQYTVLVHLPEGHRIRLYTVSAPTVSQGDPRTIVTKQKIYTTLSDTHDFTGNVLKIPLDGFDGILRTIEVVGQLHRNVIVNLGGQTVGTVHSGRGRCKHVTLQFYDMIDLDTDEPLSLYLLGRKGTHVEVYGTCLRAASC